MFPFLEKIISYIDSFSSQSRMMIVFWALLLLMIMIIVTLFWYTILDYDFYQNLANRQQIRKVELSVNRGTIYGTIDPVRSSNQKMYTPILATTSLVKDLKLDPTETCNISQLEEFISQIVYEHLCQNRAQGSCFDNVLKYTNTYIIPENFSFTREAIVAFLRPTINEQVNRKYKTRILLSKNVSTEAQNIILSWAFPGIYIFNADVYVNPLLFDSTRDIDQLLQMLGISLELFENALTPRLNRNVDIIEKMDHELTIKIEEMRKKGNDAMIEYRDTMIKQGERPTNDMLSEFLQKNTFHKCIKLEDNYVRQYPEWSDLAQIIGFVDRDGKGQYGIEAYFHEYLAGKTGIKDERRDSIGRPIFNREAEQEIKWSDLLLTIDPNIQRALMEALQEWIRITGANNASAIIMDPDTGAIRAMGSYPTFDPDRPWNVDTIVRFNPWEHPDPVRFLLGKSLFIESPQGTIKKYFENTLVSLFEIKNEDAMAIELANPLNTFYIFENQMWLTAHQNLAISSPYEPGSIFKWLTVAIGLDTWEIEPDEMYEDRGKVKIDQFTISNLDNEKCQWYHSFRNALNYSCNVGMIEIAKDVGRALFYNYLMRFGFWDKTNVTLDGENTGFLETYEKWPTVKLLTMSFWQWISVNLIQMAAAYSVLANGGVYYQPHIVVPTLDPVPIRRVITETTSKKITAMLSESTQKWFAKAGAVPWYQLAGKTGTSQIASVKWGFEKGENGRTNTSYAGYWPSHDPKFVIVVRFDRPRNTQYAEFSAAKTFRDIATFLTKYYGIQPYVAPAVEVK